ncbi:hypothetical protein QRX60_30600 [Amycolatopsis mongoliensis]|uniref:DUF305 domain-containing protein n=1 Tax=Amycolatopsis mongoliensis TaxID=715475 RepID=A0A9Y2JIL8_9PSEU|nr:hypothetical protein [Amycolatopsis sp. 4-36]WIX98404.1 hypothetical protein QRX60_30600 [Amycolatopsis sp. 4-36]
MRNSYAILLVGALLVGSAGCGRGSDTAPSPVVIPGTSANAYIAAMVPALDAVNAAVAGIPTECGPWNEQECRVALQRVHDANAGLEKTLAAGTVPDCLREADTEMRTSVKLMDEAMHNGIDGQSYTAVQHMARELEEAGTHEIRAMNLLQNASC